MSAVAVKRMLASVVDSNCDRIPWGTDTATFTPNASLVASLQEINVSSLLEFGLLRLPYVAVSLHGKDVPTSEYTETREAGRVALTGYVVQTKLKELLDQGGTLMFHLVDQWIPAVGSVCAELRSQLAAESGATIFWTPRGTQGLSAHRDDTHVFAFQLSGAKVWRTEQRAPEGGDWTTAVADDWVSRNPHRLRKFTVAEGEGLYMPPGVVHVTSSEEQPSLHLSLWIRPPRVSDLIYVAAVKLSRHFPPNSFAPPPGEDRESWAREILATCSRRMGVLGTEELLTEIARRKGANASSPT